MSEDNMNLISSGSCLGCGKYLWLGIQCMDCLRRNFSAYDSGHPDWRKTQVAVGPYHENCLIEHKRDEHAVEAVAD